MGSLRNAGSSTKRAIWQKKCPFQGKIEQINNLKKQLMNSTKNNRGAHLSIHDFLLLLLLLLKLDLNKITNGYIASGVVPTLLMVFFNILHREYSIRSPIPLSANKVLTYYLKSPYHLKAHLTQSIQMVSILQMTRYLVI